MVSVGSRLTAYCRHFGIRSQSGIQLFWDIGQFLALESYLTIQNYVFILVLTRHQQPPDALPRLLSFCTLSNFLSASGLCFLPAKSNWSHIFPVCFYLWFWLLLRSSHLEGHYIISSLCTRSMLCFAPIINFGGSFALLSWVFLSKDGVLSWLTPLL